MNQERIANYVHFGDSTDEEADEGSATDIEQLIRSAEHIARASPNFRSEGRITPVVADLGHSSLTLGFIRNETVSRRQREDHAPDVTLGNPAAKKSSQAHSSRQGSESRTITETSVQRASNCGCAEPSYCDGQSSQLEEMANSLRRLQQDRADLAKSYLENKLFDDIQPLKAQVERLCILRRDEIEMEKSLFSQRISTRIPEYEALCDEFLAYVLDCVNDCERFAKQLIFILSK